MAAFAIILITVGSLSLLALAGALVQASSSGSVELSVAGLGLGSASADVALLCTAAIAALAMGTVLVGIEILRTQGRGRRAASRTDARVKAAELEARAHLLEYRIEVLTEQLDSLEERRLTLPETSKETPFVPAAVDPRLVPGRKSRRRPLAANARETATLVVVPEVQPPASPNGDGAAAV